MNEKEKELLKKIYKSLDIVKLRKEIMELLNELSDLRLSSKVNIVNLGYKNYDLTYIFQKH